jgi:hypothetical protein
MTLDKNYLNLAGEYRVASELFKRGVCATITYGNLKGCRHLRHRAEPQDKDGRRPSVERGSIRPRFYQKERIGPSEIHRRSVKPVKDWLKRHWQQSSYVGDDDENGSVIHL